MRPEPQEKIIRGYRVLVDQWLGHLAIYHEGKITWDILQTIKNDVWGAEASAIEVYPATSKLVNAVNCRHLWRLGAHDFCPDLNGFDTFADGLEARYNRTWAEARE